MAGLVPHLGVASISGAELVTHSGLMGLAEVDANTWGFLLQCDNSYDKLSFVLPGCAGGTLWGNSLFLSRACLALLSLLLSCWHTWVSFWGVKFVTHCDNCFSIRGPQTSNSLTGI